MGKNHNHHQRIEIAQQAAKLMIEHGIRDHRAAKIRAVSQLGLHEHSSLPSNAEIEHEREVFLNLFYAHDKGQINNQLQQLALKALKLLQTFNPYLVGDVVNGNVDQHSRISIHIYEFTIEQIEIFLMEHAIPYQHDDVQMKIERNKHSFFPRACFEADQTTIEIIALPYNLKKSPPLSPVNGQPYKRLDLHKLENMISRQ